MKPTTVHPPKRGLAAAARLHDLLELHDRHRSKRTLPRVLGDAFFYATNPVFRRVRNAALAAGVTYSAEDTATCYGWPLMALDEQLRTRRIPFVDNVFTARLLERRRARHFRLDDLRSFGPAKNPLLHESAHALAFDALDYDLAPSAPTRLKLMKTFLAEAYALAVEKVSGLFVSESKTELFLHRLNTHVYGLRRRRDPVVRLHDRRGLPAVLRATMAAYLYASFLYRELGDAEDEAIRTFAGLSGRADAADVSSLLDVAFDVGTDFRHRITSNYLRAHGYSKNLLPLVDFEPLHYLQKSPALTTSIDRMIAMVAE